MRVAIGSSYLWKDVGKVGLHAFGEYFLNHGRVAWFTIPFSVLHFVKPTKLRIKLRRLKFALFSYKEEKGKGLLINHVPFSMVHPISFPPLDSYFVSCSFLKWTAFSWKGFLKKEGLFPLDLLFFDTGGMNLFYPLHKFTKLVVYRLNDLVAEFPGQVRGRIESEREVLRKADLVLAVSEGLYDAAVRIRGSADGIYLLPNGVHLEPFQKSYPEPDEYIHIPRPRALFVGALSSWFDWEFLRDVAKLRPNLSFVVIGKGDLPKSLPQNVYLLGPRPHERIPVYMQHADVGLIIFKELPLIRKIEKPLKFYEYLAAGLPIVSVSFGNLKKMAPFALFGDTSEEFAAALDQAVEQAKDPEERVRRKREAERYSWGKIFERFEQILRDEGVQI